MNQYAFICNLDHRKELKVPRTGGTLDDGWSIFEWSNFQVCVQKPTPNSSEKLIKKFDIDTLAKANGFNVEVPWTEIMMR